MMKKTYLGDGCYAELNDVGQIELTTSDGIRDTNTIYLEPEVWSSLVAFARSIESFR